MRKENKNKSGRPMQTVSPHIISHEAINAQQKILQNEDIIGNPWADNFGGEIGSKNADAIAKASERVTPIKRKLDKQLNTDKIYEELVDLAKTAWNDKQFKKTVTFKPSEKFRNKVQEYFEHDVDNVFITADAVRHIKKRHAENEDKKGQIDITPEAIAEIYDVVNNFDIATKKRCDGKDNRTIMLKKEGDGTSCVILVERGNSKAVVKTFYKHKGASQMSDAKSPNLNAQSDFVTAPLSEVETSEEDIAQTT